MNGREKEDFDGRKWKEERKSILFLFFLRKKRKLEIE